MFAIGNLENWANKKKKVKLWSSHCGAAEMNPPRNNEVVGLIPGLDHGIAVSCVVGYRCLDPTLLWLWHKPAAVALIRPLAWEPPYVVGVALKSKKKKKKGLESDPGPGPAWLCSE